MGRPVEDVCGGCPRNGTRPGRYSPHLTAALALASHLDELRNAGASFPYPTALPTSFAWACLKASKKGRDRADEAKGKRAEERRRREAEEANRNQKRGK